MLLHFSAFISPTHIQLGDGHSDVIHRQSPLQEQILTHVCQGRGRVNGISANSVSLQVRCGITALDHDNQLNSYRNKYNLLRDANKYSFFLIFSIP